MTVPSRTEHLLARQTTHECFVDKTSSKNNKQKYRWTTTEMFLLQQDETDSERRHGLGTSPLHSVQALDIPSWEAQTATVMMSTFC